MMIYKNGIIVGKQFYPNTGSGHEKNAREIIKRLGWTAEYKKYYQNTHRTYQDFLIMEKGAIQLGSSGQRCIIYSVFKVSSEKIDPIIKEYNLNGYQRIPYSR